MSFHLLLTLALLSGGTPALTMWRETGSVPVLAGASRQVLQLQSEEQAAVTLARKARDHLKAARALLAILEADLVQAKDRTLQFQDLYEEGLVSRRERDAAAARVGTLELRKAAQVEVCNSTELLLTELTQAGMGKGGTSLSPGAEIRQAIWDVSLLPELANFFWHRFGKELPISAVGQTPTHDYLGFDHRDRVDLALHPKSPEGEAVIEYLTYRSLPFQAFSTSRSGSATGAHIHIGPISDRLLK